MATAKEELALIARGDSILNRCAPDEPVFLLRAKDVFAYGCVVRWIKEASHSNRVPQHKIDEAEGLLQKMLHWQIANGFKYPD